MVSLGRRIERLESRIAPAAVSIPLSSVNGGNGFRIIGAEAREYAGETVSAAGDVNGDGLDDFFVGTVLQSPTGVETISYVLFGKRIGFPTDLHLSDLDGENGFRIVDDDLTAGSQVSITRIGDMNGDGFGDLAIGVVPFVPTDGSNGEIFVVFGGANFASEFRLSQLDGTNGFRTIGRDFDAAGSSLGAAGDMSGLLSAAMF